MSAWNWHKHPLSVATGQTLWECSTCDVMFHELPSSRHFLSSAAWPILTLKQFHNTHHWLYYIYFWLKHLGTTVVVIWRFINWIEWNWIRFILATRVHPFITLVLFRVVGLLEPVPDATGWEAGYNLHKLPLYLSANTKRDKQPFTHTTAENNYQLT